MRHTLSLNTVTEVLCGQVAVECATRSHSKTVTEVLCGQVAVECATRSSTSVLGRMAEIAEVLSLLKKNFFGGGKLEVLSRLQ